MADETAKSLQVVGERAGQAVVLVVHDGVDIALLDIGQQGLQRRAVYRAARETAGGLAGISWP